MRKRIKQREVPIHVLIFNECPAHDNLRNQNERDNVGRRFRIRDQRGNQQAKRHAAHGCHEHNS